jgi:outer membrane receptor protein involved in Fe transport
LHSKYFINFLNSIFISSSSNLALVRLPGFHYFYGDSMMLNATLNQQSHPQFRKRFYHFTSLKKIAVLGSALLATLTLSQAILAEQKESNSFTNKNPLEEVIVLADFRKTKLLDLANSISVLDAETIKNSGVQHLDQLLVRAPNVNFSSGASRGRFLQIRGIGERSQFVDPINPSVGLIIDGIDFTGLGLAASTLDIEQIEILRGPQGTLYGANALAGLVNLTSFMPTQDNSGSISLQLSEDFEHNVDTIFSNTNSDGLGFRVAARFNQQDGDYRNTFTGRDNTNNIDEKIFKGTLYGEPSNELSLKLSGVFLDIDNGYDAFSLNNNRKTSSDEPGRDAQETIAGAVTVSWRGHKSVDVEAVLSGATTETRYNYDEDWSYVGEFANGYSSADSYIRDKDNTSFDLRLISKPEQRILNNSSSWVLGLYQRFELENLSRPPSLFDNRFKTRNHAIYGQLTTTLTEHWTLNTGLRIEQRVANYSDSEDITRRTDESLIGGRLALEYRADNGNLLYALISRGYKADGVNGQIISAASSNADIPDSTFLFDTETLLNYEIGSKSNLLDNALQIQVAAFYQDRKNAQTKQSIFNPDDFSFDDYLSNAQASGMGIELEANYYVNDQFTLYSSIGYLDAEFEDFITISHVDARDDAEEELLDPVNLDGRDIAHAPNYQFFFGGEYKFTDHWSLALDIEGKDAFHFSNSHNQKSDSYEAIHARITYNNNNFELMFWGRNLSDEDVEVRGFYFSNQGGNNPGNNYTPETYTQLGEPRILGATATLRW